MTILKKIRFQKYSVFNDLIFICNSKEPEEKENYDELVKQEKHLRTVVSRDGTFIPIYSSSEYNYATIRCRGNSLGGVKIEKDAFYDINYNVRLRRTEDKEYINIYINKIDRVGDAKKVDRGDVIEFD
jgi:hypothetical protein